MLKSMVRRALNLAWPGALALAAGSCAPPATSGGFDSPNPASRMYAMEQAVRDGDRAAVRDIIEALDSDDPAVRLLAIESLQRLTGRTYGYRHFDPPHVREEAIRQWVAAEESGEFAAASRTSGQGNTR